MDSSILINQLNQLKKSIVFSLENSLEEYKNDTINFTKQFFFNDPYNPNLMYSIYGLSNKKLLYDSIVISKNELDIFSLPIEGLLFVKEEIDFYKNSKIMEMNSQSSY